MALSHSAIVATENGRREWKVQNISLGEVRGAVANGDSVIRTYFLDAVVENPPVANCDVAFDKVREMLFSDVPADAVDYEGVFGCGADDNDIVTDISLRYALEARTEADVTAFEAYLASHQGQVVWGTALNFRRVFAVLADTSLRFLDQKGEEPDVELREIARTSKRQLFVNMKQQFNWIYSNTELVMEGEIEAVIAWISSEFGNYYGTTARNQWLREANVVELRTDPSYLMEDRTFAFPANFFAGGDRYCGDTANGRCL